MKLAIVLFCPLVLASAEPDRLVSLIVEMRRLTLAGDQVSVGRLVPSMLEELAKPHPGAALGWNQLGVYYDTQSNFEDAERAYQRGIRLLERQGTSNGDLALLLLNLATLYLHTGGRPAQAEMLCRRALKAAIESHGPQAPELSSYFFTLGAARMLEGERKDARRHFEQALALADDTREGRALRGIILGPLAVLMGMEKQWIPARDTALKSIQLTGQNLGLSHPDLISLHLNLACIYVKLKEWALARAAVERARQITEARLGPEHLLMAEVLRTSAFILQKTGHRSEARELNHRAKAIVASKPKGGGAESWIHVADLMRRGRR